MALGVEVGLGPGHIVVDGDRVTLSKKGRAPPQFSAHVYRSQTAGCIKMPLGMEVGISPGDFVLDGDPQPLPKKGRAPNFPPMSIVAKRLHGSNPTWYGSRPRPRRHCIRWGPSSLLKNGAEPEILGPCLLWPNGCMDQDAIWYGGRPRPRRQC